MKRATLQVREYRHSSTHPYYLDLRAFGQGRKFFKTKAEAEAERSRQSTLRERGGRQAVGLPLDELAMIIKAKKDLAAHGKTIRDAASFYLDYLNRVRRCNVTVAALSAELLANKRRDGHAPMYLADLKKRLTRFSREFGDRPVAAITVEELDNWLRDLDCSPKSRANFRANVGVLFSHAERRGIIDINPILRTAKPKLPNNPPEIFRVNELRGLLEAAAKHAPDVVPLLAIGAFAGLRDAEIKRLDWSEVDLLRNFVEVTSAKAKTARRRIVEMQPNLVAWLAPFSARTGPVVPINARNKMDVVRNKAGLVKWPNNGLRHSFASYRLAAIQDAPRVASELGHASPQMLYSNYRELVLPEEAKRYWKIAPAKALGKVVAFTRTA